MAQKQTLGPTHFIQAKSLSTSFTSPWIDALEVDNLALQIVATGSPTGAFTVNVSPDSSNLTALPLSGSPTLSGSGDSIFIDINQLPARYVQVTYTATSGTGTCDAWFTGKSV